MHEYKRLKRDFTSIAGDLLNSDDNTFDSNLNQFKAICSNETILEILNPVLHTEFDTQEWFKDAVEQRSSFAGSGKLILPVNKLEKLKLIYDLLWDDNPSQTAIALIFYTMATKKYADCIRNFNNVLTKHLVKYISEELSDMIPVEQIAPVTNYNTTFNNSSQFNVAQGSHHVTQNMQVNNPDLSENLTKLKDLFKNNLELSSEEKEDAIEILEAVEEETNKEKPKKTVMKSLLNSLPVITEALPLVNNVLEMIQA